MKVVLIKDVKGSGKAGDVIEAKDGFAQNFIIKKGLAVIADAKALNENKAQKDAKAFHRAEELEKNKQLKQQLGGVINEFRTISSSSWFTYKTLQKR